MLSRLKSRCSYVQRKIPKTTKHRCIYTYKNINYEMKLKSPIIEYGLLFCLIKRFLWLCSVGAKKNIILLFLFSFINMYEYGVVFKYKYDNIISFEYDTILFVLFFFWLCGFYNIYGLSNLSMFQVKKKISFF